MVSMELLNNQPTTQITLQTDICFAKVLEQMPFFKVDQKEPFKQFRFSR